MDSVSPSVPSGPADLAAEMSGLLASFGVTPTATRDAVTDAVAAHLAARRIDAKVVSLRHGRLTVAGSSTAAAFLRLERSAIRDAANAVAADSVRDVRIRVDR